MATKEPGLTGICRNNLQQFVRVPIHLHTGKGKPRYIKIIVCKTLLFGLGWELAIKIKIKNQIVIILGFIGYRVYYN